MAFCSAMSVQALYGLWVLNSGVVVESEESSEICMVE